MNSEIRCETEGCAESLVVDDDITQYTAAAIARDARWLVIHGMRRDYHHCAVHGRSAVAIVLRFAASGRTKPLGEPHGIHAALRELDAVVISDAVWSTYYAAGAERAGSHRDQLLEAARRAEAQP